MDTLGIIRQIEADAGLRAQLRAVLLGDEILELPRRMAELADGQRRLQDAMEQTQATLTSFMASTDVRLTSLESDVSGLKADVSGLKGSDLERRLREQPARYLDDYVERIRVVGGEALDDLLESLERQEPLDVDERRRLRRTDLIADARRVGSTERLTVVGEVSVTLHDEDVTRAAACSEIFRRRGRRSLAIAAGAELGSEGVARLAQTYDVELVRLA